MHYRFALTVSCLLILLITGFGNGFECSPGCDPNNGFCQKPEECRCKPGWQGARCNQCVPFHGCLHGSCEKPWQCICEDGWVGSQCDVEIHPCASRPCYNNSTCTETSEGSYLCVCARGYTGNYCHLRTGPCLTNGSPCLNGGTCTDDSSSTAYPSCLCPPGFAGDFCEIDVDDCEPNPCANGGSCIDHGPSYTCQCPPGFTGPRCNNTMPPCTSNPCANGGTCLNYGDGTVRCLCVPGFMGPACTHHRAKSPRPKGREDGLALQHYSLPSHIFHKLMHPPEKKFLKVTMRETVQAPSPIVAHSKVICFVVLGLLTCLVILGTTSIIFFNRCKTWMANAKYTQLVRQQQNYILSTSKGKGRSINIILPEKIKLTNNGNHYISV